MANFHNESWIMENVANHFKDACQHHDPQHIFGIFLQGSQNYGLDVENSDIDTKLITIPSFEEFCFNKQPLSHTYIRDNDEHIDMKDLRLYFQCFRKQNINFVEILFTPYRLIIPEYEDEWIELYRNREAIAHYNPQAAIKSMKGMALEKFHAMEHPYPSKIDIIERYGYDCKQLHHLLRLEEFIARYLAGDSYEECLYSKDADYLMEVKANKFNLIEARAIAKETLNHIECMADEFLVDNDAHIDYGVDEILNKVQYNIIRKSMKGELLHHGE